jgi:hypothetical protein
MSEIKTIVAKQNPDLLSLGDKARYKVLPDILTIMQIACLWSNSTQEMIFLKRILRDAVISGELFCNQIELDGYIPNTEICMNFKEDIFICVDIQPIHKNDFKKYIDANNWNLTESLLNNWFDDIKTSKYKIRDDDFKAWINEKNPNIETMTKANIQNELIKRNSQLWTSGFSHWWKQQNIYKGQSGRKKN